MSWNACPSPFFFFLFNLCFRLLLRLVVEYFSDSNSSSLPSDWNLDGIDETDRYVDDEDDNKELWDEDAKERFDEEEEAKERFDEEEDRMEDSLFLLFALLLLV